MDEIVITWYGPFWLDDDLPEEEFMDGKGVYMILHSEHIKARE